MAAIKIPALVTFGKSV